LWGLESGKWRGITGYGIMTWFPVREIFGPVGPEKMVICDRSAFAERSCKKSFCGTRYGIMTWFCVSKIFGPVGPEKTVICDRSAFAERSCRGRTKGRKARMSARPHTACGMGDDLCKTKIRRTWGADGGTGNPSPTTPPPLRGTSPDKGRHGVGRMIACNAIVYAEATDNPSVICFANATSRDRFPSGSDQYTKGGFGRCAVGGYPYRRGRCPHRPAPGRLRTGK